MDREPASEPADPTLRLTRDAYYIAVHTLRGTLPPPEADTQEAIARRDHAAIVQVAAMLPANADEACLAALCVAARLYGMDCIRQAREFAAAKDQVWQRKCDAQGLSALRESRQARALLDPAVNWFTDKGEDLVRTSWWENSLKGMDRLLVVNQTGQKRG